MNLDSNQICVDKGSEFYNKSWLQNHNIKMYSAHNEGKFAFAWRIIKTLKKKIYKYMTSISKRYVIINWVTHIIQLYMKLVDVKSKKHKLTLLKNITMKILNLKLVITWEYQTIKALLQKFTFQIGLKKFWLVKKLKYCVVNMSNRIC